MQEKKLLREIIFAIAVAFTFVCIVYFLLKDYGTSPRPNNTERSEIELGYRVLAAPPKCEGGFLTRTNGTVITENGQAVKC